MSFTGKRTRTHGSLPFVADSPLIEYHEVFSSLSKAFATGQPSHSELASITSFSLYSLMSVFAFVFPSAGSAFFGTGAASRTAAVKVTTDVRQMSRNMNAPMCESETGN